MQNIGYTQLPWLLNGEGFILNYWITPQFSRDYHSFGISPTRTGRLVQIMLVRYHSSPVGPYDELLLLDHPIKSLKNFSTIPKIYVSSQASVDEGRYHWGIPKELANFEWRECNNQLFCYISSADQELSLHLKFSASISDKTISSSAIPKPFLNIQQHDENFQYDFQPQFTGSLGLVSHAFWKNTQDIFPDFSQATFLKGLYSPSFQMQFPKAVKIPK